MNSLITVLDKKFDLSPSGGLHPITSFETGRYEKACIVELKDTVIKAGMFASSHDSLPTYLPPQWTSYVHPEGDTYFYRSAPLPVVTETYLYHSDLATKVSQWVNLIEQELVTKQIELVGRVELYVKLGKDNDCYYYFVDHDSQTLFWIEDYDSNNLSLPQVVSSSHMQTVLKERYWNHVQSFPDHLGGLPIKALDDLICVLNHAIADHMTSDSSTFPYDENTCRKFVKLLKNSRDHINDRHTTSYIARIWSLIENNRYWILHGQENARLSRTQAVLVEEPSDIEWIQRFTSLLSWNVSQRYATRLNELYIDHYVYQTQWSIFMKACFKDWKSTCVATMLTLFLHILLNLVPFSRTLAFVSASLLSISLLSSMFLIHSHDELREGCASDAHGYLTSIYSKTYKFQWAAFTYSMPKTFYFWGTFVFFSQWMVVVNILYGAVATAFMVAFLALCALGFWYSMSELNIPIASKLSERTGFFSIREHDLEKDSPV